MLRPLLALLLLALLGVAPRAWAQPEAYNWKFGNLAGLHFSAGGGPAATPAPGGMGAYEGCASVSDAAGTLQCYTNGLQVWDRTGAVMPNGQLRGSDLSATQAALLLRGPGQTALYYLFNVGAVDTDSFGTLRYSLVDMSLRGGLGDVSAVNSVAVPVPDGRLVTEKLTAVLHANGRDYWIVVHGWENNAFYAYLLSPDGLAPTPVVSAVGAVHTGAGFFGSNAIGYLRASPDGRLLAAAQVSVGLELLTFDPATGQASNPRALPANATASYGVEFSPDNTKLYVSNGASVRQFDLADNLTQTSLPGTNGGAMGLQRGPDGQIYVCVFGAGHLAIIHEPNAAGLACHLEADALTLQGTGQLGLPNFPNAFAAAPLAPKLSFTASLAGCAGDPLLVSTTYPVGAGDALTWDFGEPAAGPANAATGPTASHRYRSGGTYSVILTLAPAGGGPAVQTQELVTVAAAPTLNLGARRQYLCTGEALTLSAGTQPAGTSLRWPDNSAAPAFVVRAPGRYRLLLTSPTGCVVRDSVEVLASPAPRVSLGPDTVLCDAAQPLLLRAGIQPTGTTYRWPDGSTGATYAVRQPGSYWLEVRNAAGCTALDTVLVRPSNLLDCPEVRLPNIITPNGDSQNEYFVLPGLRAADWALTIHDRWGREIFRQARYDNRWNAAGQPAGLYYYLLQNAAGQQRRGWVEVVR